MAEILVIEDDSILADLIQLSLEQQGHQVIWHAEKEGALASFEKNRPALVILDLFLPQTDTLALIRHFRDATRGRFTPAVIVLSALGYSEVVEGALNAGANDYLLKPLNPDILLQRVQSLLSSSGKNVKKTTPVITKPQFRRIR